MATIQSDIVVADKEPTHRAVFPCIAFQNIPRWFAHALLVLICIIAIFFLHELSHAAVVLAFGGRVIAINVLGIQWFPFFRYTPQYGYGGYVAWLIPPDSLRTHLIVVAGSTGTLLIAFCAAISLNAFRPRGLIRTALIALSFYIADSLFHIIPVLHIPSNAAPPWVRSFSEAYFALVDLGVPGQDYVLLVFLSTAVILGLLALALIRTRTTP
ncbi:MAG TPA: hypothetical protein VFD70_20910 [Anaerolineae bacterium]|nr:hypothetical protein [Anaerolineae bacterium]